MLLSRQVNRNDPHNKTHLQLVEQLVTSELELAVKDDGDSNAEAAKEQCEMQTSAAPDNSEAARLAQEELSSAQMIEKQVRFYTSYLCTVSLLCALSFCFSKCQLHANTTVSGSSSTTTICRRRRQRHDRRRGDVAACAQFRRAKARSRARASRL